MNGYCYSGRPGGLSDEYSDSDEFDDGHERIKPYANTIVKDPLQEIEINLRDAALEGDLEFIDTILKQSTDVKLDSIIHGGWTLLMYACSTSKEHIVTYLLEAGADPNKQSDATTALMCACSSKSNHVISTYACVKTLLDKKAAVNVGDRSGVTPLMKAIMANNEDIVDLLLPKANVEMKDDRGRTAIFYATDQNNHNVFSKLVTKGAKLDLCDKHQCTLKMMIKEKDDQSLLNVLKENMDESDDDDDNFQSKLIQGEADWKDVFPGIFKSNNKCAYYYEIPKLLHGMNCERLTALILNNNINLETFLCLDDLSLNQLGVIFPFERKKIIAGLHKFHLCKWKLDSVVGLKANKKTNFDSVACLSFFGSHLKHITVLKASICYALKDFSFDSTDDKSLKNMSSSANEILDGVYKMRNELNAFKNMILELNKKNLIPADLIQPNNPLSKKSMRKTKCIICVAATTVVLFSVKTHTLTQLISKLYVHLGGLLKTHF